jgi:hypothetical protein
MQGRCDEWEPDLLSTNHWEAQLIEDEQKMETARKFVERFHSEWRHIIDRTHMRAKLGTKLEIGPVMRISKKHPSA